jgi:hypothetical protein
MKVRDIHAFFTELDRRIAVPVKVLVTGGAAAILQGVKRATHDIDFEITLTKPHAANPAHWGQIQKAIDETGRATGITPQYAEDIDRWSSIALPAKTSRPYLKLGKVDARILDPGPWSIGKLTRFLSSDVDDLITVLKEADTAPAALARFWGKALGMSPASNAQALFKRQVESFLDLHARHIWPKKTDAEALKTLFNKAALAERKRRSAGRHG